MNAALDEHSHDQVRWEDDFDSIRDRLPSQSSPPSRGPATPHPGRLFAPPPRQGPPPALRVDHRGYPSLPGLAFQPPVVSGLDTYPTPIYTSVSMEPSIAGNYFHGQTQPTSFIDSTTRAADATRSVSPATAQAHRRGYQACDPCRKRKVKCERGDVDRPRPGKCKRCEREQKECVVAPVRRKRKSSEVQDSQDTSGSERDTKRPATAPGPYIDGYNGVPGQPYTASPTQTVHSAASTATWHNDPRAPNSTFQPQSGVGRIAPKPPPNGHSYHLSSPRKTRVDNVRETRHLVKDENTAVSRTADFLNQPVANSADLIVQLSNAATKVENGDESEQDSRTVRIPRNTFHRTQHRDLNGNGASPGRIAASRIWAKMKFVRAGWLTSDEAMSYLDFFYERLAPLTPIVLPDYREPALLKVLLTEEPILAVTLLSIASRYAQLQGPAHVSRTMKIQDRFWASLREMVQRLLWGQEQFGGGFCGGGAVRLREAATGQLTWKGSLRTLGTVEALLLLTDWHPAALHFPPGDDEGRLLSGDDELVDSDHEDIRNTAAFASWLEPQWRSDRMSWMILGLAQSLSFELGVFDRDPEPCINFDLNSERARKLRVRRLVLLYVSQTSGRLGITSTLSLSKYEGEYVEFFPQESSVDTMQKLWLHISSVMNYANEEIFLSKEYTRELTSTGRYSAKVDAMIPVLKRWKEVFEACHVDTTMKHILLMEYEYARLYINSVGLQAMVSEWAKIHSDHGVVAPDVLRSTLKPNKKYIDEVCDAARHILESTLEGLVPQNHLRQATVRTYSRVLSGLLFSLKCLVFGAKEPQFREWVGLIEETTKHLREMVVDDVHLASYSADLVSSLTKHLRKHWIRFVKTTSSLPASRGVTPFNARSETPQRNSHQAPFPGMNARAEAAADMAYNVDHSDWHRYSAYDGSDPFVQLPPKSMNELPNLSESYMPPPETYFAISGPPAANNIPSGEPMMNGENNMADWMALPLNGIINNSMQPVDQGYGGIGLTIGSKDMLEYIGEPDYNGWSSAFQGAYQRQ